MTFWCASGCACACGSGGSGTLAKSVANLDTPLLYEDGVGGGARAVEHPHAPSHRHGYGATGDYSNLLGMESVTSENIHKFT
jgi:hypothetical protein